MADLDSIASSQSLSVSLCGDAVDIPILAPVAALTQFMETANSTDNVTAPSASYVLSLYSLCSLVGSEFYKTVIY